MAPGGLVKCFSPARIPDFTLVVIQLSDATRSVFVTASCVRADALLLAGVFRDIAEKVKGVKSVDTSALTVAGG
jgi:hypothetical protein